MSSCKSFREEFGKLLIEIGEKSDRVVVVTADVGLSTRASMFGEKFRDRYFNVGIAEQHLIGFAAGLAIAGAIPIATAFAEFILRGWEQIRNSVARMNLNVKIVATHAGYSDHADGASHQALEDIALMRVLPNMAVVVPADTADLRRCFEKLVLEYRGPTYIRLGRDYAPPVTEDVDYEYEVGKAYILKDGHDVAIIGAGVVLHEALVAAKELDKRGISACVVNLLNIKPIDVDTIVAVAKKTGRVVVVEEHMVYGGVGSAVAEILVQRYPVPMRLLGATSFGRSAKSQQELLSYYGLDNKSIIKTVLEVMNHE
ncbi:MAG: transketolase family protein [Desulfurococcaceae archaeon]|nr:transketolase family protein [Desulfurococcaceae archaeon]